MEFDESPSPRSYEKPIPIILMSEHRYSTDEKPELTHDQEENLDQDENLDNRQVTI